MAEAIEHAEVAVGLARNELAAAVGITAPDRLTEWLEA